MIPFLDRLDNLGQRVLLAGAGGGFDVYSGIPIYHWLRERGRDVVLANLSFSSLTRTDAEQPFENVFVVKPDTEGPAGYFPEGYLAQFLDVDVYGFRKEGVANLTRSYAWLCEHEQIDDIVLVDGGTDSLMRGDEPDLGTPAEDLSSLWAASQAHPNTLLAAIGFGIDTFHGVNHYYMLEAVAELTRNGGFLGSIHLLPDTPGVELYDNLCTYAFGRTSRPSIVSSHILAAIHGTYGDVHPTTRTMGHELWLNPLMAMYWTFELQAVVDRHLFLADLAQTETAHELTMGIAMGRATTEVREWRDLRC